MYNEQVNMDTTGVKGERDNSWVHCCNLDKKYCFLDTTIPFALKTHVNIFIFFVSITEFPCTVTLLKFGISFAHFSGWSNSNTSSFWKKKKERKKNIYTYCNCCRQGAPSLCAGSSLCQSVFYYSGTHEPNLYPFLWRSWCSRCGSLV